MKLSKHQAGFSHILVIVVFLVLAGIGLVGWKVYDSKRHKDKWEDVAIVPGSPEKQNASILPDGFIEYENKELGFRFAYPKEWGEVKSSEYKAPGILFAASFTNKADSGIGVAAKDYKKPESLGDPPCVEDVFAEYSPIEVVNNSGTYPIRSKEVLKTADRNIVEVYKDGYCGGSYLRSRIKLNLAKSNGITIWYSIYKQSYYINKPDIKSPYPDVPIDDTTKAQFIEVVKSVKVL